MRILIILIFLLSNSFADETTDFKNLIIKKDQKKYEDLSFLDSDKKQVNLDDYRGKLVLLNFWASWCAPCKEEMPSLGKLHEKDGIFVFPINLEEKNLKKVDKFYNDLNIKNLNSYFDEGLKLVKVFALRGVPTSIILNKNKEVIARISGSIDFGDKKFISWLYTIK